MWAKFQGCLVIMFHIERNGWIMADKPYKNGRQNYDWDALKTEYVTTKISLREMSAKHGISYRTVAKRSKRDDWVESRKKHFAKVTSKALSKVASKQSDQLAKELDAIDKLSDVITDTLKDADQFRRHLVETMTSVDGVTSKTVEEKVFNKIDTRALKDAAQTLKLIEEMKRSILNIQKMDEINRERREQRKLEMEEERLEMQKQQADLTKPDKSIQVVISGYEDEWSE